MLSRHLDVSFLGTDPEHVVVAPLYEYMYIPETVRADFLLLLALLPGRF